jgi:hypothetical protein
MACTARRDDRFIPLGHEVETCSGQRPPLISEVRVRGAPPPELSPCAAVNKRGPKPSDVAVSANAPSHSVPQRRASGGHR